MYTYPSAIAEIFFKLYFQKPQCLWLIVLQCFKFHCNDVDLLFGFKIKVDSDLMLSTKY